MKTPSKSFQTQKAGGCPHCSARPPQSAGGSWVLFASVVASFFGVLGALILAMPKLAAWSFGPFIVSNIAWLVSSAWLRQWPLHIQQWVFLACSLLGLWNWWLAPLARG